ncbi:MAG: hypothetical protein E7413_06455 [Ruminococcaceae bacterium]|nr:hypothetical protein [Oscillospiraceae bacterium]
MADKKKLEQFINGIFSLGTNFGELAQLMIKELEKFTPADGKYFDLLDSKNQKIEAKFSRAKKKLKPLKKSNIIDLCLNSASDSRVLTEAEATNITFDCNIQQIKPSEFDILYYGIFFKDKIVIFKAQSDIVPNMPGYSIQHKGGTEYQFHINKSNYAEHKKKYFHKELTYSQLLALFEKK